MNETKPKDTVRRLGMYGECKVAANTTIYAGTMVAIKIDKVNNTAYAVPAEDKDNLIFVGVAMETSVCDENAGKTTVKYWKEGEFNMKASGLKKSDVGRIAYVKHDGTISVKGNSNVIAGYISEIINENECWIHINDLGIHNYPTMIKLWS